MPTIPSPKRIATLRERCLQRKIQTWHYSQVALVESLRQTEDISSWPIRCGLRTRHALASMQFEVDDLELLMGRQIRAQEEQCAQEHQAALEFLSKYPSPGQTAHCELDVSDALALGIDGLAEKIEQLRKASEGETADTYQSFLLALEGLTALAENAAATATKAMASADEQRKTELAIMAESCARIAHQPPQSFRDALQLLWLIVLGVMKCDAIGLTVPGHLDRWLWPFYQKDIQSGTLSKDEALVLIESLYLLINENVPDGLAISIMVGGRNEAGEDVTNELSYLSVEAIRRTKLVYPTVGVCWHEGTPQDLTDLTIELMAKGYTTPAFFGDEVIQRGLADLGVPTAERCNYINSTCVEITPAGGSNVYVASPYFNMCDILLRQIEASKDQQPATFEGFLAEYIDRAEKAIAEAVKTQNAFRAQRKKFGGKPLQSVFTRDCIARGRDIDNGGAEYNWVECSFVGLANLTDSLHVIRKEVFDSQAMTLTELHALLESDFAQSPQIQQKFLHGYPKYGQNDSEVDGLLQEIVNNLVAACSQHRMAPDDSPFVPGAFCWIMHEYLGRETGATPDGRKAGTAFADGGGPAQGRETSGPTAAILSTTSWDHSPMIGGLAYNMKFDKSLFTTPQAVSGLRDLVLTFLRKGGFETQINVLDKDLLEKARANPDNYKDLVVRIGGYCDYFTRLSPQMQDEVILRTQFESLG